MHQLGVRFLALLMGGVALAAVDGSAAAARAEATCGGLTATHVGTARRDRIAGTAGDDVIVGLGGDDVLRGGGGNDVICGGRGADKLVGGDGDDELRGGLSRVSRGDGEVFYHRDHLVGGEGDDVLVPGYDGGSHDSRWDLLDFSDAPGPVVADIAADTITGHGQDVVVGDHYAVLGSRHDDTLIGDDGDDELYGWDGADDLRGGPGDDRLDDSGTYFRRGTAAGDDVLDGGPGRDDLDSDDGNDRLLGGGGADYLSGYSDEGAVILAGPGNDHVSSVLVLSGEQGLDAGRGNDLVYLLPGYLVDGAVVRPRTVIDLAAGTARIPAYDLTFPFAGTDRLMSYLPALTWSGTDGPDRLEAAPAFDEHNQRLVADGRGGDDRINGTHRADRIDGGLGHDTANGEGGNDECISVEVERSC